MNYEELDKLTPIELELLIYKKHRELKSEYDFTELQKRLDELSNLITYYNQR